MRSWARRIAIAKALTKIREELTASERRTKSARIRKSAVGPNNWSLPADNNKARIEEALLAMDVFPRAAVLLSIFEGVRVADAATLLDQDVLLVRKALAIGLREFTAKLATKTSPVVPRFPRALAWAQLIH
jgi:DNA-directed RNA polymerase specialized sigma24 family protein